MATKYFNVEEEDEWRPGFRPCRIQVWLAAMGMDETLNMLGHDKEEIRSFKLWKIHVNTFK